jgi:hypothetical protein
LRGQFDNAGAAVVGIVEAADEPTGFQAVHGSGHRSAGEEHFAGDGVHRHGSFVEKDFEDAEVGATEIHGGDAADGVSLEGAGSFPEDEPEVSRRRVL